MKKNSYVTLACTKRSFRPVPSGNTRWWAKDDWREYHEAIEGALGWGGGALLKKEWIKLYQRGYRYCATFRRGRAIAIAGLWPRTKEEWEVIAVGVRAGEMGKGHGGAIVSFVTDEILKHGRRATIGTRPENAAMLRAARAVGFQVKRHRPAAGSA
jgi:RimJ/RimL family protein N-acetyltransferase